jgi:hypothetical protein
VLSEDTPRFNVSLITMASGRKGPKAHVHEDEDDAFYVLDGELTFVIGEEEIAPPTGGVRPAAARNLRTCHNRSRRARFRYVIGLAACQWRRAERAHVAGRARSRCASSPSWLSCASRDRRAARGPNRVDTRGVRRSGDKPASEPPTAPREQVVRLAQLVAARRRPRDQAGAFELEQRPDGVRAVGHELRFAAVGQRDPRRAEARTLEPEAEHAEPLRIKPESEAASVVAHDCEPTSADPARGWWSR